MNPSCGHQNGQLVVDANACPVELEPLPNEDVLRGAPQAGVSEIGTLAGTEYGLWEMSTGVATDVESDEVFVVIAGEGSVLIAPFEGAPARTLHLVPGSIIRLHAGMHTTWTVTSVLRKVWFAPSAG